MFRAVADCRDEITGPKAYLRGETIKRKKHADIDEWQTEMQLKAMQIGTVHLYSGGLPDREHALTGVKIVQNLESAVIRSAQRHKTDAVIPQGPYVMPFVAGEGPI